MTKMSKRQCEISAEAYATHLLARCGYDVFVQYGANQPKYDLVAVKNDTDGKPIRTLFVSVKGGQTGGWMLATKKSGLTYHESIQAWKQKQSTGIIFMLIEFKDVPVGSLPRAYIAKPDKIAKHLCSQFGRRGWGALVEDSQREHPHSQHHDKIPCSWKFTQERIDKI